MSTQIKNLTDSIIAIDGIGIVLPPNGIAEASQDYELKSSDDLINKISAGTVSVIDSGKELLGAEALRHIFGITDLGPVDRSGKLRIHETSRALGTMVYFTGVGDDPTDPHSVGGGERILHNHVVGTHTEQTYYIDFNCVDNETWLHEGYLIWKDCQMDSVTMSLVSRVTETEAVSGGNYNVYGDVVIPAVPGTGTVNITSDITQHDGGLVYMPNNDLDEAPVAFWNADWDKETKRYVDITPAPNGDGRYNMFVGERKFATFANSIPLLGSGFERMQSADTDQLGQGIRLKLEVKTNGDDHVWQFAGMFTMNRERTV